MAVYKVTVLLLVICGMALAAPGLVLKNVQAKEKTQLAESSNASPVQLQPAADLKTSETLETPKESLQTAESFGLGYYAAGTHLGVPALPHAFAPVYATYLSYLPAYYHSYRHHGYGGYGGYGYGLGVLH